MCCCTRTTAAHSCTPSQSPPKKRWWWWGPCCRCTLLACFWWFSLPDCGGSKKHGIPGEAAPLLLPASPPPPSSSRLAPAAAGPARAFSVSRQWETPLTIPGWRNRGGQGGEKGPGGKSPVYHCVFSLPPSSSSSFFLSSSPPFPLLLSWRKKLDGKTRQRAIFSQSENYLKVVYTVHGLEGWEKRGG